MDTKKELRSIFSKVRASAKNELKDQLICARLLSYPKIISADTVLMYASFGSEVNTWDMAEKLLQKGIVLAYPKCGDNGKMDFHCISSLSDLCDGSEGKFGICEPCGDLPIPEITDRTVCIVPALALTEKGVRLGYGGGFYDRFLSAHPGICTVAPAYEAVLTDKLPQAEHDIKINAIVTEERLVLCNE